LRYKVWRSNKDKSLHLLYTSLLIAPSEPSKRAEAAIGDRLSADHHEGSELKLSRLVLIILWYGMFRLARLTHGRMLRYRSCADRAFPPQRRAAPRVARQVPRKDIRAPQRISHIYCVMPDEMIHRHFAIAVRHAKEGERRVAEQLQRIQTLRHAGLDTATSQEFLDVLVASLKLMNQHLALLTRECAAILP